MKKFLGIMTSLTMAMSSLSCLALPAAIAADTPATTATAEANELTAGNINDQKFDAFSIKLDGDTIKVTPNKFENDATKFYMYVASDSKSPQISDSDNDYSFTVENNSKYVIVILEKPSDIPSSVTTLDFYYFVPIICRDNVVDIDADNIYATCNGEENSYIVKTNKRLFGFAGEANPNLNMNLPKDKPTYSFKKFENSWLSIDNLPVFVLSCFFEEHFFLNNNLVVLSKDNEGKFYADFDMSALKDNSEPTSKELDDIRKFFEKDLTVEGIDSINGLKPASKAFCLYPNAVAAVNTVYLKDDSGITKYHIDAITTKYKDPNGNESEDNKWLPDSFTAVKIPEKDINLDGAVNLKDVVTLRRYIAGGWGVELNDLQKKLADMNGDGELNLKDVVLLRRHIAGGWEQ